MPKIIAIILATVVAFIVARYAWSYFATRGALDAMRQRTNDSMSSVANSTAAQISPGYSTTVSVATSRTVPPPSSMPGNPGEDAYYSAVVGDCMYYNADDPQMGFSTMRKLSCDDPHANNRVTARVLDPSQCPGSWAGLYKAMTDYSQPKVYDLVLCFAPI